MPDSIKRIKSVMPEKVEEYATRYSFADIEKYIRYAMMKHGIYKTKALYDECFSNAALSYYYSICRCAFKGYAYVIPYIRKMIGIAIICGINLSDETAAICEKNNLRPVNYDTATGRDQF